MFHVMLHENVTGPENFETEGTEEVLCVFMDAPEMCLQVGKERGPVIANLWNQQKTMSATFP